MASRNQNRPPKTPSSKKDGAVDIQSDKRRKVGVGRMVGPTASSRARQVLAAVNLHQESVGTGSSGDSSAAECLESLNFTKDEVEALLNEKIKGKKFDLKGKMEQTLESNKKLRLCIRWFQRNEEGLNQNLENLRKAMEAAETQHAEIAMEKKNKEDELNTTIGELRQNCLVLQEKFTKEESDKLDAIESHRKETEARVAAEKMQASLLEELAKVSQAKLSAEQKVVACEERYERLQVYNTSLQVYNAKMQEDLATITAKLQQVEQEKVAILETLSTLRGHYSTVKDQLNLSKVSHDEVAKQKEALEIDVKCLRGELQQVRDDRDRHSSQVQALRAEIYKYEESTGKSVAELESLMTKSNALEETCASQREQLHILQHQLAAANEKLKVADLSASETRIGFEEQKQVIHELKNRLADAELQINEGDKLRKKLHNTILELKGNIRVFCRVRPLLPEENSGAEAPIIAYPGSTDARDRDRGIDLIQTGQRHCFTFDKVFDHEASQYDVFGEISQLVQSALDGYKVCIFAYGQTGSGKTYTMMGNPGSKDNKGLIPRSLEQIFEASQHLSTQGWKYKMQASMLEIYNETIRDLIPFNNRTSDMTHMENGVQGKQYSITHDANGNTSVSDLTVVDVCSTREVSSLLLQAAETRSVGKTNMNEQSSRSHFVFTLRIFGVNESTEQQVQGVLNLIDLAGSERLSKSGATGDRLKETKAINKSLSCLADVIFALAKKEEHVPFRNSKLTYLLKPCLGGDSKTLMVVNISPEPSSVGESINSLRFAARVNSCEIGIPRRQTAMRCSDSRLSVG
ncbi:Kinesin-like protein KIN-14C [Dionaea muscipula]